MRTDYPRSAEDVQELAALVGRAYADRYDDLGERLRLDFHSGPKAKPEYFRILRRGGRMVAHAAVYEKLFRLGRAGLRTGGVGFVGCLPEERRRGYAAACVRDALAVMERERMPLSLLSSGVDCYYTRFGYVGCFPRYALRLSVQDAEVRKLRLRLAVREYRDGDLPELLRLYDAASARTPGAVIREARDFRFALKRTRLLKPNCVFVFRESRGRRALRAYVVWKEGAFWEAGLAPGDEAAAESALAWLRDRRRAALEKELVLQFLTPAHPLWRHASRFNHGAEYGLQWTGGWMGRIVDLRAFLAQMKPEWEGRLNAAGLEAEGHLHLEVDGEPHSLVLSRAHHFALQPLGSRGVLAAQVRASRRTLLQMSLGTLPWRSLPDLRAEGEAALLDALFPHAAPGIFRLDYF
jgi:hypothetical protein